MLTFGEKLKQARISRNLNDISNEIHNLSDFFNKE